MIALNKGLKLDVINSSLVIKTDKNHIKHIIQNLVSNAIYYTHSGKVLLGCRRKVNSINLEVWDTGPGISEKMQDQIFLEFTRGDELGAKDETHFGIGLSIVEKMSQALGYCVKVKSLLGKGTVFIVEIPRSDQFLSEIECEVVPENEVDISLDGKVVLCVDDDFNVLDSIERFIVKHSGTPLIAQSLEEAIDILNNEKREIDLIISDYHFSNDLENCGVDVVCKIRDHLKKDTAAFIMSGDFSDTVKQNVKSAGLEFLPKPLNKNILKRTINRMVS